MDSEAVITQDGQTALSYLFTGTGGTGVDPGSKAGAGMMNSASDIEFLNSFQTPMTGINGGGPILNANANLLPTRSDTYRDLSSTIDFKLSDGLGNSKTFRKADSQGGQTVDGFHGLAYPSKLFGRTSRGFDLNLDRDNLMDRARNGLKNMGHKPNEVPEYSNYFPWQWNDLQALGIGGTPIGNPNQYNRNYSLPDADQAARRLYKPAPSRITKMMSTDVEDAALRPQQTMMHPLKVVTEDRQRMKLQRAPRNVDVMESVVYEGIAPRGMGAARQEGVKVWANANVLRQPIGSNDTGDKSVFGRVEAPQGTFPNPLAAMDMEDRERQAKFAYSDIGGKDPEREQRQYLENERKLQNQMSYDTTGVNAGATNLPLLYKMGP